MRTIRIDFGIPAENSSDLFFRICSENKGQNAVEGFLKCSWHLHLEAIHCLALRSFH